MRNVGDVVGQDEPIIAIETDKVSVEVRAPNAGTITSLLVKESDDVNVGTVLFVMDTDPNAVPTTPPPSQPAAAPVVPVAPAPEPVSTPAPPTPQPAAHGRVPLIKFRHGRGNQGGQGGQGTALGPIGDYVDPGVRRAPLSPE